MFVHKSRGFRVRVKSRLVSPQGGLFNDQTPLSPSTFLALGEMGAIYRLKANLVHIQITIDGLSLTTFTLYNKT